MKALAAGFTFFARRLTQAALVMLAILIIAFAVHAALGDPLREIMGEAVPEAEREELRHTLGLDAPWPVQLARYLGGAVKGEDLLARPEVLQGSEGQAHIVPSMPGAVIRTERGLVTLGMPRQFTSPGRVR